MMAKIKPQKYHGEKYPQVATNWETIVKSYRLLSEVVILAASVSYSDSVGDFGGHVDPFPYSGFMAQPIRIHCENGPIIANGNCPYSVKNDLHVERHRG